MKKRKLATMVMTAMISASAFATVSEASSMKYTVKSGDSLWKISTAHNVSIANLKEWNKLSSDSIYPGQTLYVSSPERVYTVKSGDVLSGIAKSHNVLIADIKIANNLTSDVLTVGQQLKIPSEKGKYTTHTVKSGDTLSLIARDYHVNLQDLKTWNNLSSDVIRVGQVLRLTSTSNTQPSTPTQPSTSYNTYTVKSGDTLWKIATANGTTVDTIKSLNGLKSDILYVGQVLKMPSSISTPTAPTPTSPTNPQQEKYVVKSGDTLSKIAKQFGTTVNELKRLNGLTSDILFVGQVLKLIDDGETITPRANGNFNVDALISEAKKYMGVPYVWGGTSPSGFDCSGFLHYVFLQRGVAIPRTVETIWNASTPIKNLQKGDIVFFETYKAGPSHAGIYLGDGTFIHASTSKGVTISSMDNPYYKARYLGAKTFIDR